MNQRERFIATMHYKPVDRSPIMDFGFWNETLPIWHEQGLPEEVDQSNSEAFFGMDVGPENMAKGGQCCQARPGACPLNTSFWKTTATRYWNNRKTAYASPAAQVYGLYPAAASPSADRPRELAQALSA